MSSSRTSDPPPYKHRTTTAILRHAATTSVSLLPTTLFLTLLLFSFRTFLHSGTFFITSFIDRDPSLKSLLSRLDLPETTAATTDEASTASFLSPRRNNIRQLHRLRHRHRPFLHLTRVGTLDDDFFSSDDDDDRHLFGSHAPPPNASFIPLSSLFPGVIRPGVSFWFRYANVNDSSTDAEVDDDNKEGPDDVVNLGFFIPGLELGRRDAAALFFLITLLSAAYGWVILGFVITYSWALGIVFVAVVNDLLGRYSSFTRSVWNGSNLGIKRLSGFILMRWAVRDAVTQVLGLWYFGEIRDQYSFFKLFLRLKLMPFSVASPWVPGYDKEISGFLFAWFLIDSLVSFVLAVNSWVTIVSTRRGGREIIKEGWYLLATMIHVSIQLKCLELIFCGEFMRSVLARVFGDSIAFILQSLIEVYFMVAWLIYYLAARCKDASLSGREFGRTELEGVIEGLR
ncbi:uncharacterized protein LOC141592162 [Silene latifolia]|uniref:uncharacterized protein LOC141592162 n=1 Tax=Silene latifolia TaxID=37657 RepID=UPI003D77D39C